MEEEEEGNTPRFIRHCKPLRSPNRRLSGADPGEAASELKDGTDEDSGNGGSIWAGGMIIRQPLTYPDAQNQRYSRKKKCELCRKINENCPNFWSGAPKKRNNLTELQSGKAKNWKFSATQGDWREKGKIGDEWALSREGNDWKSWNVGFTDSLSFFLPSFLCGKKKKGKRERIGSFLSKGMKWNGNKQRRKSEWCMCVGE